MGIPHPDRDSQFYEGVPVRRLAAFVIDMVVIFVLTAVSAFVLLVATFGLSGPIIPLVITLTGFFYRYLMLKQRSATIGMLLTGIEVRNSEGDKLDNTMAFLHTATYTATFIVTPLMLIGWFLMLSDSHRRLMHDSILGTVVINRPR
ncbi:MAG: RDD family protein [Pseudomonadota bacterium]